MGHWTSFFKKSFTLGFYNVLIQGINFVTFAIVARFLESSEYGLIALITVFSGFLTIFSDAGLSFAVVREDFDDTFLRKLASLSVIIGLILMGSLAILAYPIAWFYENDALFLPTLCLSFAFLLQSIFLIPKSALQKKMIFNKIGLFMAMGQFVVGTGTVIMAWLGYSYWALIFPQLIGLIIQAILFCMASPIFPVYITFQELKSTISKVKSLLGNISGFNMINYWARNADNLLIGKFYGEGLLGIYNYAYKLFIMPQNILNNVFSQLILPSFKKLKEDGGDVKKEYMRFLGAISVAMLVVGLPMLLFPNVLVRILFGPKWIDVAQILPYFGLAILTQPLVAPVSPLLILYKKEKILLTIGVLNSIVIVTFISLGIMFSVEHVAFFYVLSYLLISLPLVVYLSLIKSIGFQWKEMIIFWGSKILFSTLVLFAIFFATDQLLYLFTAIYCAFVLILERKNVKDTIALVLTRINL